MKRFTHYRMVEAIADGNGVVTENETRLPLPTPMERAAVYAYAYVTELNRITWQENIGKRVVYYLDPNDQEA